MKKRLFVLLVLLGVASAAGWYVTRHAPGDGPEVLHGNIDHRQVDLAFKDAERVSTVQVDEGDAVAAGDVVATLETERLDLEIARSRATVRAQEAVLARLEAGSRPQEIRRAEADVAAAAADAVNARAVHARMAALLAVGGVAPQDEENARAARDVAEGRAAQARAQLALVREGPRSEDIDEARAALAARRQELAVLERRRVESVLVAPAAGVVRKRLLEPGDMAAPSRPVCTIDLTGVKWVRVFVPEAMLATMIPGRAAEVSVDGAPGKVFAGRVAHVAASAEFTPRNVETPELRTSLVYEVRVLVDDPGGLLRLGMPATVRLVSLAPSAASSGGDVNASDSGPLASNRSRAMPHRGDAGQSAAAASGAAHGGGHDS